MAWGRSATWSFAKMEETLLATVFRGCRAGVRHAHLDAGADHVAIQVLTAAGHEPMPAYQRLAHSLL